MRLNVCLTIATLLYMAAIIFGAASAFAAVAAQELPPSSEIPSLIEMYPVLGLRGRHGSGNDMPVYAPDKTANNRVVITGGVVRGLVTGAYAPAASESSEKQNTALLRNRVILLGGEITGSVHGAFGAYAARADGNTLLIDDRQALVRGEETAGFDAVVTGAVGRESNRNTVLMHAGTIYGNVSGGEGGALSSDNRVLLHGGFINGAVYGGSSRAGRSGNNSVIMTGGTVQEQIIGGNSAGKGIAGGNTVLFSGGITAGIMGSVSSGGPANGNTIVISGGDITPPLKRGKTGNENPARVSGGESTGHGATGNRIFLGGATTLRNCVFYGGYNMADSSGSASADYITGNTMSIESDFQGQLPAARNFENIYLSGQGTSLSARGYNFHPSVRRFSNFGLLRFSPGRQAAVLRFSETEYFAEEGALALGYHTNGVDRVVIAKGSLLLSPVRIRLEHAASLPVGVPMPIVEINKASSMRGLSRRDAVTWASGSGGIMEMDNHVYQLKLVLGGEDKDIWSVEKKQKLQEQK